MNRIDAEMSHTSYGYIDTNNNILKKEFIINNKPVDYKRLLKNAEIGCLTVMYNQYKLGKCYMPNLRRKQDYALWFSILKKGSVSMPIVDVLAFYRLRKGANTSNKWKLITPQYALLREQEKLNIYNCVKYTIIYVLRGFLKYGISSLIPRK